VIAVDPTDASVYVSGESFAAGDDYDIVTIKHTQPASGGPADLTNMQIVTGTVLNGTIDQLTASDDAYVHTRSGYDWTAIDMHHMELRVTALTTFADPSSIDLTIEDRIDVPSGRAQIRLRNWNSGAFDLVGTYAIGTAEEARSLVGIDAPNYVGAAGEIEISIKHIVNAPSLVFTFESFIDHVNINVR
jgi:hypothetical protein